MLHPLALLRLRWPLGQLVIRLRHGKALPALTQLTE
jgi:hypothetical protein